MKHVCWIGSVVGLVFAASSVALAQQAAHFYIRTNCVKVRDGKGPEYAEYLKNVVAKLAKYRVDNGTSAGYVIAQAVLPAGRAATCDYLLSTGSNEFPRELTSAEQTDADYAKAGVTMTRGERIAKQVELSYLVKTEIWSRADGVGVDITKGGYITINFFNVKTGMANWLGMETSGWKQVAEAGAKEIPGTGWAIWTLTLPGGQALPYNAMTIDSFPTWEALGKGLPAQALWAKVHPQEDFITHMTKLSGLAERPHVDVFKVVDFITK